MDQLLPLAGLPALDVPAAQVERAREPPARHGMLREASVDLADIAVPTRRPGLGARRGRTTRRTRPLHCGRLVW
ncbi:hypothetical protein E1281_39285 [Actinomadura sp. KC345]|uniref:hypothetical protein n=1 Tax=Actinomadura sp. KC345 TaxID=2530371 RepID=UPI0010443169|nr:hypothetical protein [Actinomadura sp. KC345]TDC38066.1 hypothetical protein E1281_39285 [Actinomadura sp. KC345]